MAPRPIHDATIQNRIVFWISGPPEIIIFYEWEGVNGVICACMANLYIIELDNTKSIHVGISGRRKLLFIFHYSGRVY